MAYQHRWSNKSSRFVSRHERINEYSSGGGGGPGPSVIKKNLWQRLFSSFLVVLHLFYRMPMVYFKENSNFPRFHRGFNIFSRGGGGGGPTFSRGIQLLIPYGLPYNLCFSRGSGSLAPPPPPPQGSAQAIFGSTGWCWQKLDMRKIYQFWTPPPPPPPPPPALISLNVYIVSGKTTIVACPGSKLFFQVLTIWRDRGSGPPWKITKI